MTHVTGKPRDERIANTERRREKKAYLCVHATNYGGGNYSVSGSTGTTVLDHEPTGELMSKQHTPADSGGYVFSTLAVCGDNAMTRILKSVARYMWAMVRIAWECYRHPTRSNSIQY